MKTSLLTLCLLLLFAVSETLAGILRVGTWSSSGSTPHTTLTAALAAARAGDEVWVVSNTYREAELTIPADVNVYGGFTGSETTLSERNYTTNVTILDGSGAHRVATVSGLLDGFTLRNGRTGDNGGGVLVKSSGTLSHCIAFANEAGYDGGGVFAEDNATVTNTLLTGNRAGNDGAALSGTPGYSAMNLTAADNLLTGKPVVDALTGVPASLQAGGVLDVTPPAISDDGGSTVLMKGWELDGNAISMPYTVTYADNGRKLRYWAANAVGVGVSTEVALTVTWTVTSSAQLLTPNAVCEGTTLAAAGITDPTFSPAPDGGATYVYSIDGTPISGLGYQLQYADNGKLLTCEIKNTDGSISGATTPAVRLAVMKAPEVLLASVASLSIEEEQPLCLPTPVVISNGSDVTAQGWKWRIGAGVEKTFNSCDKTTMSMNGSEIYYTAENGCGTATAAIYTSTLTVTAPVGNFLQTVSALCSGMTLDDCISFADGGNTGDYYIGNTYIGKTGEEGHFTTSWDDVKATVLTVAHNLQTLWFSYNGGKSERRMTLTVHAVPEITTDPATPGNALCLGDAHTLTIEATGDNLSYQWERSINSTDGTDGDWDNVPGSTSAACRLTADVSAYYRCTVTGVCIDHSTGVDNQKITSDFARVTVHDRPVIPEVTTLNPLTLCEGETVTALLAPLKPVLGGTPATAEGWTLGGINIADDYSVAATDNGKLFGYHASNACGERTVTFSTLKLTVDSQPKVTQDPLDVSAVEDTPVRLSVSASGNNLTYKWQQKAHADADEDANWHDIAGETTPVYNFTAANITMDVDLDGADVLTDYRCVVGTTNACATTTVKSAVATVTVTRNKSAVSIRRQPAAYEVCNSDAAPYAPGFTVEVEGSGRFVYKWYETGDKTTPVEQTPASGDIADAVADKSNTFKPSAAGTYFCVITSTDDAVGAQSQTVMLTVSQAPVIHSITPANATICEGGSVTLGVDATGSALTYQWYQQAGATRDPDTDTKKGTAPTYTPVGLAATAKFYCVVGSGSVCTATETSNTVEVTIEKAPRITTQPLSQSVCGAAGIDLIVVADNTDTWQWYYNGKAITEADGGKKATLADVKNGGVYTCVVSKTGGVCGEATSVPALITVANSPEVKLGTATGLMACKGDLVTPASPVVEANGSVVLPEKTGWYLSTAADPATAPVVASCVVDNTVTYNYKITYKCSATSPETTITAAMPAFTVTVNTPVAITSQPEDQNECSYQPLSVAATGTPTPTYKWYYNGVAATTTDIDNIVAQSATPKKDGVYTCEVSNACGSVTSAPAVVKKKAATAIATQPSAATICKGQSTSLGVKATGDDLAYQWYSGTTNNPTTLVSGATSATLSVSPTVNTYYKCVVSGCTDVPSGIVLVTVNTPVQLTSQPKDQNECSYQPLSVAATGTATISYKWYYNGVAATATHLDKPAESSATPKLDGVYTCEVSNACGSVTSAPAVVKKKMATVIATQPLAATICKGQSTSLGVKATGDDLAYQWYSGTTNNPATLVSGATSATLSVSPTVNTYYKCIVSGCTDVTSSVVLVTVKAATVITALSGLPSGKVCNTATMPTLAVAATGEGTLTYQWYKDGVAVGSGTGASYAVKNTDLGAHSYEVKVTGECGSLLSQAATVEMVKAPTVALAAVPTMTVCPGELVTLPVVAVEANGSVLGEGGWLTSVTATTGFASAITAPTTNDATATYYYRQQYTCGGDAAAYTAVVSATVKTVAAPPKATFTNGASATTTCEGDEVTLPAVNKGTGTRTEGYWMLNEQMKGDITKYKVHSADDKQVFKYVNVNRCGIKVTSDNTYTLNVKQPARITSLLSSPVIFKAGDLLNTKITTPTDNHGTVKKWTLNGTEVQLTKATTLTDDAGRLVYSVDNGCTTGIGAGGIDETSTTLQVWYPPVVRGSSSITTSIYGKEGSSFGLPSIPVVSPNNCKIVSAGWKYDAADNKDVIAHGTTTGLTALTAANFTTHDKKYLYYEVAYQIPGDAAMYYVRRAFGQLVPWKEPTIAAVTNNETWNYVCDNKTFAAMSKTFATVECTDTYNCAIAAATWETENGRVVTVNDKPSLTEDNKKLYCVRGWTAPDGSATGKVKSQIATMRVNNVPRLTVTVGAPGTNKIVRVGADIKSCYYAEGTENVNGSAPITYSGTGSSILNPADHYKTITITASNMCGSASEKHLVDLGPHEPNYYKGVAGEVVTIVHPRKGVVNTNVGRTGVLWWAARCPVLQTQDISTKRHYTGAVGLADDAPCVFDLAKRSGWVQRTTGTTGYQAATVFAPGQTWSFKWLWSQTLEWVDNYSAPPRHVASLYDTTASFDTIEDGDAVWNLIVSVN